MAELIQVGTDTPLFNYTCWTELLEIIVTPAGKVDYTLLMQHHNLLQRFITELGTVSPDTAPDRFPTPEHALAYWINAYNAFVLAAVSAEYPVRSVWKVRDGQFFTRVQHSAGGVTLSLNDIEHRVLRGRFHEPRIHFALNCASNGCPPMRPQAFEPTGLQQTLHTATQQFLASEWNCRIDHAQKKIFVSRLFRMYAEDFAGTADSTLEYRHGVLRFVAEHTGEPFETLADYAIVYNIYDWGLNDAHRDPQLRPITFHESVETFHAKDGVLRELYLYDGNFCNRACSWCTVFGSPQGWYQAHTTRVLDSALATVAQDGNIKFYGGEPTLHSESLLAAMRYLRARGFSGLFTIYSNGVKARTLIDLLDSDLQSEAVLNYSIYLGRDAEPLPTSAKALLEAWGREHPMRLFTGYKVLYHVGAGVDMVFDRDREPDYHALAGCVLCFPVLKSTGEFHACPLAIENPAPHFQLGDVHTPAATLFNNYQAFRTWAVTVLDPAARERQITSCAMCQKRLAELPDYRSLLPEAPLPANSPNASRRPGTH
ncbi:MAG: DUF547 domain-containing protein [Candidatus Tectomicrobia bacterium]|uniref:DUF547 domain-containing protein n=1 Tax=Tectimicrobiota bacterium TaxID=2528274 RepID=A0A937W4J4_UNCTE|nr:DUF547 domain-containing protein [Candidatus Tectomicrobia bacterium]